MNVYPILHKGDASTFSKTATIHSLKVSIYRALYQQKLEGTDLKYFLPEWRPPSVWLSRGPPFKQYDLKMMTGIYFRELEAA